MEVLKIFLDFASQNIWPLVLVIFIVIFRSPLSQLIARVVSLTFKLGESTGGIEVIAPDVSREQSNTRSAQALAPPSEANKTEREEEEETPEVGLSWFALVHKAFSDGDADEAARLFDEHLRSGKDLDGRFRDEALFNYWAFSLGGQVDALERLKAQADQADSEEKRVAAWSWLSACYEAATSYEKAEALWRGAALTVTAPDGKARAARGLAHVRSKLGAPDEAKKILQDALGQELSDEWRTGLLEDLIEVEDKLGNEQAAALLYEQVLDLNPGDHSKLFAAAYAQSQAKLPLLSLKNYTTLVRLAPTHPSALNNLGVCASELKAPGKSISFYRRAAQQGETLAMANIGRKQIEAGFFDEARKTIEDANKHENPHENVASAITALRSAEDSEDREWQEMADKATSLREEALRYGDAYLSVDADPTAFAGRWSLDTGQAVESHVDDDALRVEWRQDVPVSLLRIGLAGIRPNPTRYEVKLEGHVHGRSAVLRYRKNRTKDSRSPGLLSALDGEDVQCLAYLTSDLEELHVFPKGQEKFHLTLRRSPLNRVAGGI